MGLQAIACKRDYLTHNCIAMKNHCVEIKSENQLKLNSRGTPGRVIKIC